MSILEWGLTAAVVLLGSLLQSATGMGLGLLVAPVLLLVMDSVAAVTVAVVLNLLVSAALLPAERRDVAVPSLLPLLAGCLLGIPAGLWVLDSVDLDTLKLLAGIGVSAAAAQLLWRSRRAARGSGGGGPGLAARGSGDGARALAARGSGNGAPALAARATIASAGLLSGIMTACLAMPGPALMWGMGSLGLDPRVIRANLRALFTVAYGVTLASHLLGGIRASEFVAVSAALVPALVAGAVLGHRAKSRLSDRALRVALEIILLVMGVTLIASAL